MRWPLSCYIYSGRSKWRNMLCPLQLYGRTGRYIATTLFYMEPVVRMQGSKTCTQSWCAIIPSCFYYQPIRKIDFISASGKKQKINEILQEKEEEHQEEPQEFYPLYIHLTYHELIEVCKAISLQKKSNLWCKYKLAELCHLVWNQWSNQPCTELGKNHPLSRRVCVENYLGPKTKKICQRAHNTLWQTVV